jgi:hypothetical protein
MTVHFVHQRMHFEYWISGGLVRLDDVVEAAAADGQPSALTLAAPSARHRGADPAQRFR